MKRNTPIAKVGRRGKRLAAGDARWRKAVKDRDGWLCQKCKRKTQYVEAHHIYAKGSHDHLRHDVRSGVTLCVDSPGIGGCHYNYAHHDVEEAREYFLSLPSAEGLRS